MGLFNFFKKKSQMKDISIPDDNPSKKRLDAALEQYERNLTISKEISPLANVMVGFAVASRETHEIDEKIRILEEFEKSYDALEAKCTQLGPYYQNYFWETWGKPREKHGKMTQYKQRFIAELDALRANRDSIFEEQERRKSELVFLDSKLMALLSENPGIIQSDVYKHFDSTVKGDISEKLYFWEKDGTIKRTKSGRSYVITLP